MDDSVLERTQVPAAGVAAPYTDEKLIDLRGLWSIILRQARAIALCIGVGLLGAGLYLVLSPPSYQASSEILIDKNLEQVVDEVTPNVQASDVESEILNQIEVLRSSRIARVVVEAEKLNTDPNFLNPPPSALGRIKDFITGGSADGPVTELSVEEAVALLQRDVVVQRVGRSSVVSVSFESHSPELAYRITTAYANAFVRDRLNANVEATREAADWLQQRLTELGQAQRQASSEVEKYRTQAGLSVAQDKTLSSQRLEALTGQLVIAQAETARIKALSDQLQKVVAAGPSAAAANADLLSDAATNNPSLMALKTRYSALQRRIDEITASFGENHPQVEVLKRELASISGELFGQLKFLSEHYQNELKVAQSHEAGLRDDVEAEGQKAAETSQSQVELNALQQRSAALDALYNSFLTRYEESIQRQSFPVPTLRVITAASLPKDPSGPRTLFVLAGGILLGAFLGLCVAAFSEIREAGFRVGSQITRETGIRFAGYLPRLDTNGDDGTGALDAVPGQGGLLAVLRSLAGLPKAWAAQLRAMLERFIAMRSPTPQAPEEQGGQAAMHQVIRNQVLEKRASGPTSVFLETLKSSRILMRARPGECVVVGVVSILPGEGKTTFAVALAQAIAASGARTLLIDADLRRSTASRLLAGSVKAETGDKEAKGAALWRQQVRRDPQTGLSVLPTAAISNPRLRGEVLVRPALHLMLKEARNAFDFVILDLPPLGPVADALGVLPWTDGFLLVTEWGRTPRSLLRTTLEREPELAQEILGVVLNKVDMTRLARYSDPGAVERYVGAYRAYYQAPAEPSP